MNNKILMISYFFPPSRTSAIARIVGFTSNLYKLDYQPVILTVTDPKDRYGLGKDKHGKLRNNEDVPKGLVIHKSFELNISKPVDFFDMLSRKALKLLGITFKKRYFREFCIPDPQIGWFPIFKGLRLARECKCIFVTCSPFSSALVACVLKKITKTPVILDFRDAWTLNPYQTDHTWIHRKVSTLMEKWVLKTCDALVLNTEGSLKLYQDNYKQYKDKMYYIPNGYDKLDLAAQKKQDDIFVITHVGSFYWTRNPKHLLEAIMELDFKDNIKFMQIGGNFEGSEIYEGKVNMEITGALKNVEALAKMKQGSLLYLKQGRNEIDKNYIAVAAKTYEYLATGLPILCDCPEGDNTDIVNKYSTSAYLTTSGDKEAIKKILIEAYNNRDIVPQINEDFAEIFSRENLTKRLVSIIEKISE